MTSNALPLVVWENGILMIGVFVLVVVILIGAVVSLMSSEKKS